MTAAAAAATDVPLVNQNQGQDLRLKRAEVPAEAERQRQVAIAAASTTAVSVNSQQARELKTKRASVHTGADTLPTSHASRPDGRRQRKGNTSPIENQTSAPSKVTGKRNRVSSEKASEQVQDRLGIEKLYPEAARVYKHPSHPLLLAYLANQSEQNPSVTQWLRRVQASVSSDEASIEAGLETTWKSSQPQMQSSSSASITPLESVDGCSTVKGVGRPKKLDWDKLRSREVDDDPSDDVRLSHFQALLHWKLPKLDSQHVEELQAIFKDFAELAVEKVDYPQVESVSNQIDKWKSEVSLARITEEHFSSDVVRCTFSNEAVLQRTIMMEIIDRHQLHQFLTFNSEGQWKQNNSDCLISRDPDPVTLPKPDLNVSFRLESFSKSAPIPGNLKKSFRPDSLGQKYGRCFPFLFFEVKRATDSLEVALMANLHSASQALLNIYAWMVRAELADKFFEEVRVFSFVFNARNLSVRMHRATRHKDTLLQYHFVELVEFKTYSKDQVCLLVRNILEKYAIEELHPVLKSAFDIVTEEWSKLIQGRRTAAFAQASAAARARSRGTPDLPIEDSTSFGISALST